MGSSMQDCSQADIVFLIEATAMNGAYINDLKSNYVVPTLEYFSQGPIEDKEYFESTNALYGLVTYRSSDCLLQPSSKCYGPYTNPHRFLHMFENVSQKMSGGRGESHAHIAEGFATALQYFEDLVQKRETGATPQKHCILICNSPPYSMPVMESHTYSGHTAENLASELVQRGIHLSVVSPRKIPALFKLYEKAGGDLQTSQTKNYAKDPRHLVLLKGFSLKERPVSPCGGAGVSTLGTPHAALPLQSMPSPSTANIGSPMTPSSTQQNVVPPQTAVVPPFRASQQNPQAISMNQSPLPNQAQIPQSQPQQQVPQQAPQMVPGMGGPRPVGMMQNFNPPYIQQGARPMGRWPPMMGPGPQQRPPMVFNPQQSSQQQQQQQGSALIAQLTQPPSSMAPQFPRMDNSSMMSGNMNQGVNQQPTLRMMVPQQAGPGPVPGIGPGPGPLVGPGPPTGIVQPQIQQGMPPNPQQSGRERHTIWHGVVEWIEKPKIEPQKITRNVPCTVSANSKDGEPELKADSWPQKLVMQLMPKQLIGNIGGSCLKNSKSVLFHPQPCEALDSLTKVMSGGYAGCVHFTSVPSPAACDIKVLILLYTTEKRAYLGFIPNDQAAFVDRLRKVIQQQKTGQAIMRAQGGQPGPGPSPGSLEPMPGQQPGMMGPGMMRPGLPGPMQPGMMGPQQPPNMGDPIVSQAGGMMNPIGGNQQSNSNSVMSAAPPLSTTATSQQPPTNTISMQGTGPRGPGMMGQRPPFGNQMEAARQQNLAKIEQLRQTLEAAQRQELQYVEIMSHMPPVKQIEQNLEHAQLQEMQYKSQLEEQHKQQLRVQLQQQMQQQQVGMGPRPPQQQGGGPQPPQQQPGPGGVPQQPGPVNQQRMMRPLLSNNSPGLRHLLQQQQPQYRQQVMGMQPPIQQGMAQQRPQQMLQNPGPGGQQQPGGQQFDEVPNFDFLS
nr:PREDICTED: mediator of RNA polymerase II transcription subunit 25 isoform X2 [Bemisia tabaci]